MLYERLDVYQKRAVRLAIRHKSALIFFEQGVGKTHPTVALIEEVMDDDFEGMMVVPLTNLETTWLTLFIKEIPALNIARDWEEFKEMDSPKLFLTNYESLPALKKKVIKHKWTFVGFDESQRLKARGTAASRTAGLIKNAEYRVALSGTPMDKCPLDLWAQVRFTVPWLYGNDRSAWTRFDARYLKPTGYMGYKRKFREEMLPVFLKEIAPYIIRVEADVLNLPKSELELVPVELLGEQSRIYRTMERDMVVKIIKDAKRKSKRTGRPVRASAGLKITQMIKLQQVCGGYITDDDEELHVLRSAKLRKLKYLLKRKAKRPTVIFCKYMEERRQIEELVERLGFSHRSIYGKVKDKKVIKHRSNVIRLFQSGKLDVVICQTKTGGVGVDLFKARSAIFFSTTFSYIDFDQCRKRIHRRGQENETVLYFIYVVDSIDEDIYNRIISKRSVSKTIFNQMKRRSLRHG